MSNNSNKKEKSKSVFSVCPHCPRKFLFPSLLQLHVKCHKEKTECPSCHQPFRNLESHIFKKHRKKKRGRPPSKGANLGEDQGQGQKILKTNVNDDKKVPKLSGSATKIPKSKHVCSECLREFSLRRDLLTHMRYSCQGALMCTVPGCNKQYRHMQSLRFHMRDKHGRKIVLTNKKISDYMVTPSSIAANKNNGQNESSEIPITKPELVESAELSQNSDNPPPVVEVHDNSLGQIETCKANSDSDSAPKFFTETKSQNLPLQHETNSAIIPESLLELKQPVAKPILPNFVINEESEVRTFEMPVVVVPPLNLKESSELENVEEKLVNTETKKIDDVERQRQWASFLKVLGDAD